MAEKNEPEHRTPRDQGSPTAGRKPPADTGGEPVVADTAVPSSAGQPREVTPGRGDDLGDEATTRLVPPPAAVVPGGVGAGAAAAGCEAVPADGDEAGSDGRSSDSGLSRVSAGPVPSEEPVTVPKDDLDLLPAKLPPKRRLSLAGALIWVLVALFGFTLVVQLRSNNADQGLATARQEDLVRILSDLEARDQRLQAEINTLEQSQRTLTSGVEGRQAALAEANKRADELGLLAGTLAGRGPGLRVVIDTKGDKVKASAVLNAVQELRGAGGEVMQITDSDQTSVRIVASTYFVDATGGGIVVDGRRLRGPYTLWVIGVPQTMQTALQIPGGVVASVNSLGGSVTMESRATVEVTEVRQVASLQYARPVS